MTWRTGSAAALLISFSTPVFAQTLENSELRLEVSAQTGSIVRLFDKRNRTEYVTNPKQVRLFELLIPDATNYSRRVVSWKQQAASVETRVDRIEIRYRELQPDEEQYRFGSGLMHVAEPRLPIEADVTLQLQGDHVTARMTIRNRSLRTITGVVFPYLGGLPLKSGEDTARIVLPSLGQREFRDTLGFLSGVRTNRYPALLAASWINFEFSSKGLGLEARSGLAAQDAYFALSEGPFAQGSAYRGRYAYPFIAWIHYPHIAGGGVWQSPEAIIHVHDSDWHTMAAEHREWFRTAHTPEPSQTWDQTLGFATFRLKRDDNTVNWRYGDIPQLAADTAQAGIRRLVIEGWRKREGNGNPAPFGEIADPRLGGASELKRVIGELQKNRVDLLFAFHPTLMNVFHDDYPEEIAFWAVKTRRGANQIPVDYLYHTIDYPAAITTNHYFVEIDPASPASDFLLEEAQRLREEYGMQNLLLKGIGQRAFLSYNRYHGVSPQDVYARGYGRFLSKLRTIYSDGLLLNEGMNDLVNPYGDGSYTWNQSSRPEVLAYSLPWSHFSNDVEALDYPAVNANFAYKVLTNLIVDAGRSSVASYPEFTRHVRALQELKLATAPYYARAEFRDHDGLKNVANDPGSVVAVFANGALHKTGIVLANLTGQSKTVSFELQSPVSVNSARVFSPGSEVTKLDLTRPLSMQLAPHQVVVLAIDQSLQRTAESKAVKEGIATWNSFAESHGSFADEHSTL